MSFDSSHWYHNDGSPFYEIASAKGEMRGVTLRDARKVGAVPSVTTVLQVVAKPQLEAWKINQGILAALTLPRLPDEDDATYIARVNADAKEQVVAAAEEGTRIHDAIEQSFKGGLVPEQYLPHVTATRDEISRLFPDVNDWVAEESFAHESGYGGKIDLHSPSTGIVIDYKGKDGDFSDKKKLAYDQHWQLAAYRHGKNLPHAKGVNIFVSRTHPGIVASHVWDESDMESGLHVFLAALKLWQEIKGYCPAI